MVVMGGSELASSFFARSFLTMTMHGVKRGTKTPRQQARLAEYVALTEDVLARVRDFVLD